MSSHRPMAPQLLTIQAVIQKSEHKNRILNNIPMDIKRLFIEQASANINTYNNSNSQHSSSNVQLIGTLNHPIKNRKIEGIKKMPSISEGVFFRQALENQLKYSHSKNQYAKNKINNNIICSNIKPVIPIAPKPKQKQRAKSLNTTKNNFYNFNQQGKANLCGNINGNELVGHTIYTTRTAVHSGQIYRRNIRTKQAQKQEGFDQYSKQNQEDQIVINEHMSASDVKKILNQDQNANIINQIKQQKSTQKQKEKQKGKQQEVGTIKTISQYEYQLLFPDKNTKGKGFRKIRHQNSTKQQQNADGQKPGSAHQKQSGYGGAEAKTDKTHGLSKNSITNTNNVRSQFANDINNKYRHVTISTNAYINKMKSKSKLKQSKNSNNEQINEEQEANKQERRHNISANSKSSKRMVTQQIKQQIQQRYNKNENGNGLMGQNEEMDQQNELDNIQNSLEQWVANQIQKVDNNTISQNANADENKQRCSMGYKNRSHQTISKKDLVQLHKRRLNQLLKSQTNEQQQPKQQEFNQKLRQVQQKQFVSLKDQVIRHKKRHMTSQPIPQFVVAAINQNNNNNGNVDDSPKKSPTKNNPDTLKYYELNLELQREQKKKSDKLNQKSASVQRMQPPTKQSACVSNMKKKITYNKTIRKSQQSMEEVLQPKVTYVKLFQKQKSAILGLTRKNSLVDKGKQKQQVQQTNDGNKSRNKITNSKDNFKLKSKSRKIKVDEQVKGWEVHEMVQFGDYY